jgi:phospholipid/cholesterol/gamma-HCH transport system ATP-binding protein
MPAPEPKKEVIIKVRGLVNGFGDKIVHDHLDLDVYRSARKPVLPKAAA